MITTIAPFDPSLAVVVAHLASPNRLLSDVPVEADDDVDRYYNIAGSSDQVCRLLQERAGWFYLRRGYSIGSIDTNNLIIPCCPSMVEAGRYYMTHLYQQAYLLPLTDGRYIWDP